MATSQLEHLKNYNLFLFQKYWDERNGEKRFTNLTPEFVKSIFRKENIDLAAPQITQRNATKLKEGISSNNSNNSSNTRKVVSDEEWVKNHNLPLELLQNPADLSFVKNSRLYSHMKFYNHSFQIIDSKLGLVVNGEYMSLEQIRKEYLLIKDGPDYDIINANSGKTYYYLEQGLTEHNPQTDIKPLRTLLPEETPKDYTAIFYGIKEGHTNSAGGVKRWDRHIYVGLKTPEGELYDFGAVSKGGITCPDHYTFVPKKKVEIEFPITKEQSEELLKMVSDEQKEAKPFNILFRNCSSFGGRVAQKLNILASPITTLEENNSLENRVKVFAFSKEISHELKKQVAKGVSINEISEKIINTMCDVVSTQEISIQQKLMFTALIKTNEALIQATVQNIVEDVKNDSELTLTEKMFNLATDIFNSTNQITFSHPNVFIHQLEEAKNKQEWEAKLEKVKNAITTRLPILEKIAA